MNNLEPKRPKWHESEFASLLGVAVVILAILLGIGGCNYLEQLNKHPQEGKIQVPRGTN